VASVTTPEQLHADRAWRRRNSRYAIWALVPGLGFVPLLYTGFRAKKSEWVLAGAGYGVLSVIFMAISPGPDGISNVVGWMAFVLWIVSGVHVLAARPEWLRLKAVADAEDPWQAQNAGRPTPSLAPSAADLAEIDRIDPMSAYVDAAVPSAGVATPPVDLNAATADQLSAVLGAAAIGEVFARRIVEERDRLGRFGSVEHAADAVGLEPQLRDRLIRSTYVHHAHAAAPPPPPQPPPAPSAPPPPPPPTGRTVGY
jgi:hypothetical protein